MFVVFTGEGTFGPFFPGNVISLGRELFFPLLRRFIDSFPPFQQKQIRLQLAANLRAVISQRLLERRDGEGRILAAEIMIVNAAIRDYILEQEKISEILKNIEKGKDRYGMQSFDQAIMELLNSKLITKEEAIRNATSPNDFKVKLYLGKK